MGLITRIRTGWNAFINNRDPTSYRFQELGNSYAYRPDRTRFTGSNERSIVTSIFNRMAMDAAAVAINHVKLDEEGRYKENVESGLANCLSLEANIDQSGMAFLQDVYMSMFDEGVVALVPVDTTEDPTKTGSYEIQTIRTGKILDWYPRHVKVRVYNDKTGKKQDLILPKCSVGIVENPFYAVMNEHSSTMQRLIRKLNLLDAVDEQSSSGKLDLIIQLPYVIKTDARRQQAETRRKDIEMQLAGSKYGIAYADGTERITQLNRPVENNLLKTIEYLTSMLFSQLSITQSILDGTADEKTMLNYKTRTIKPIVLAVVNEIKRKFLTKTARSQKQSFMFFTDPFEFATLSEVSEASDKLTRNEILSKNEVRQKIGYKPSSDPKADQLVNSNISQPNSGQPPEVPKEPQGDKEQLLKGGKDQNGRI